MKLSQATLSRMKKSELIELVLELQSQGIKTIEKDLFGGKELNFKKCFENYSAYANGNKKYGFNVSGLDKTLYIKWAKYVPSGYSDNCVRGEFTYTLSDKQLKEISKKGFTHQVILPMISRDCNVQCNSLFDKECGDLRAA